MSKEKRAMVLCVVAFIFGSVIMASLGCAAGGGVRVGEHGVGAGLESRFEID